MPNNHYYSTYMMAYYHLMAKLWHKIEIFARSEAKKNCLHGAVKYDRGT